MSSTSSAVVVIVAGGKGQRIGGDKALRILGGKTLLDHAIGKAAAFSSRIAVAANEDRVATLPRDVTLLIDEIEGSGPISGLLSALEYGATNHAGHVLTISCDTPFLPDDLLAKLSISIGNANAAVVKYDGRVHPICALWRADALHFLRDYLKQNRRSLIGFAEAIGYVEVEWPAQPVDPFFNINTADDLAEAARILASKARQA